MQKTWLLHLFEMSVTIETSQRWTGKSMSFPRYDFLIKLMNRSLTSDLSPPIHFPKGILVKALNWACIPYFFHEATTPELFFKYNVFFQFVILYVSSESNKSINYYYYCYLNFVGKPWLGKPWLDGAQAYGVIFDT